MTDIDTLSDLSDENRHALSIIEKEIEILSLEDFH